MLVCDTHRINWTSKTLASTLILLRSIACAAFVQAIVAWLCFWFTFDMSAGQVDGQAYRLESGEFIALDFFDDSDLNVLNDVERLSKLDLSGSQVSDQGIEAVDWTNVFADRILLARTTISDLPGNFDQLPSTRYLDLRGSSLNDAGLDKVQAIHGIDTILLGGTNITTISGWQAKYSQSIEVLDVSRTSLGDISFHDDARWDNLVVLNIESTVVDDDSAAAFIKLPHLERLYARSSTIGDLTAKQLSILRRLVFLDIQETNVTDRGLNDLGAIASLSSVKLSCGQFSSEALIKFISRRPALKALTLDKSILDLDLATALRATAVQRLYLHGAAVEQGAIEELVKSDTLTELSLRDSVLTKQDIASLALTTRLVLLDLKNCDIVANDLIPLMDNSSIEALGLSGTNIGDDVWGVVKTMTGLSFIDVSGSAVQSLPQWVDDRGIEVRWMD